MLRRWESIIEVHLKRAKKVNKIKELKDKRVVKGGIIYIDIEFENAELTAKEAMEEFAGDCDLHIKGDFKPITRGKGTALSAH